MTVRGLWTRRLTSATAGTAALLMVTGIAYATWSATGAGSTAAAAGTTVPLAVVVTDVGASLYPGGSATLTVKVSNPNPRAVTLTGFGGGSVTASSGCTSSGVTLTPPSINPVTIAAGDSSTVTLPGAVAMSKSSTTDCQGATFTVALQANAKTA